MRVSISHHLPPVPYVQALLFIVIICSPISHSGTRQFRPLKPSRIILSDRYSLFLLNVFMKAFCRVLGAYE